MRAQYEPLTKVLTGHSMRLVGSGLELHYLLLVSDVSLVTVVLGAAKANVVLADLLLDLLLNWVKLTRFAAIIFRIGIDIHIRLSFYSVSRCGALVRFRRKLCHILLLRLLGSMRIIVLCDSAVGFGLWVCTAFMERVWDRRHKVRLLQFRASRVACVIVWRTRRSRLFTLVLTWNWVQVWLFYVRLRPGTFGFLRVDSVSRWISMRKNSPFLVSICSLSLLIQINIRVRVVHEFLVVIARNWQLVVGMGSVYHLLPSFKRQIFEAHSLIWCSFSLGLGTTICLLSYVWVTLLGSAFGARMSWIFALDLDLTSLLLVRIRLVRLYHWARWLLVWRAWKKMVVGLIVLGWTSSYVTGSLL